MLVTVAVALFSRARPPPKPSPPATPLAPAPPIASLMITVLLPSATLPPLLKMPPPKPSPPLPRWPLIVSLVNGQNAAGTGNPSLLERCSARSWPAAAVAFAELPHSAVVSVVMPTQLIATCRGDRRRAVD